MPTACFGRSSAARLILALTLACALLSGAAPLAGVPTAQLCTMACCAGKAPHTAGSCMGGSCHAHLLMHRETLAEGEATAHQAGEMEMRHDHPGQMLEHEREAVEAETFRLSTDEVIRRATRPLLTVNLIVNLNANRQRQEAVEAASVLHRPCPQDCGAATFNTTNQSRTRFAAVLSQAVRPRPPNAHGLSQASIIPFKTSGLLRGQCAPRAPPPLSFS